MATSSLLQMPFLLFCKSPDVYLWSLSLSSYYGTFKTHMEDNTSQVRMPTFRPWGLLYGNIKLTPNAFPALLQESRRLLVESVLGVYPYSWYSTGGSSQNQGTHRHKIDGERHTLFPPRLPMSHYNISLSCTRYAIFCNISNRRRTCII